MTKALEQVAAAVAEAVATGRVSAPRAESLLGRMLLGVVGGASGAWRDELLALEVPAALLDAAELEARTVTVRPAVDEAPSNDALERLVVHIGATLDDPAAWEPAAAYDSLALAIIDSIWSIGVRYGGVLNVLDRYRAHRRANGADADGDTPQMLADTIDAAGGPEAFAALVANRQRTSTRNGILKAEAVYREAEKVTAAGVRTPEDLAAMNQDRLDGLRTAWTHVPGQGSGLSWNYFLMLARMPGVKADRMVRRFVAAALNLPGEQAVTAAQAARLVTDAAARLGVEDRVLDYAIWLHQSAAAR